MFRLTDLNPIKISRRDVKSVIVKTLKKGEPESVIFGELLIRGMMGEFVIPKDRIIRPNTQEFADLIAKLGIGEKVSSQLGGLLLMEDLSALGAKSIASKLEDASSMAEIDEFFAWVKDEKVAKMVGKLMVYDAVIGNDDRISAHKANYGNLMIRKRVDGTFEMFVIDTADKLGRISEDILNDVSIQGGLYEGFQHQRLLRAFVDSKDARDELITTWFAAMPKIDPKKGAGLNFLPGYGNPYPEYVEYMAKQALASSQIYR